MRESNEEHNPEECLLCNRSEIAELVIRNMLEVTTEMIDMYACKMTAGDDCSDFLDVMPACFRKSYDVEFMEKFEDRSMALLDMFEDEGELEAECVADEMILALAGRMIESTDTWEFLNKKGRRQVQAEVLGYFDLIVPNPQIGYLEEKTQARALADPDFIRKNGIKNLHIDKWFIPFNEQKA